MIVIGYLFIYHFQEEEKKREKIFSAHINNDSIIMENINGKMYSII